MRCALFVLWQLTSMCLWLLLWRAGVAPGVKVINLDVFQTDGTATWSDLLSAVNWAVANRDVYNITAINLSLGGGEVTGMVAPRSMEKSAVYTAVLDGLHVISCGNLAEAWLPQFQFTLLDSLTCVISSH